MSRFEILSGDFLSGKGTFQAGVFQIETDLFPWPGLALPTTAFRGISAVSEESSSDTTSALTLGLAGAMVLGPLGAVAGFALSSQKQEVTFMVELHDGRTLLGLASIDDYQRLEQAINKRIGRSAVTHPHGG